MIVNDSVVIETERLFLKKFEKTDFRNFLVLHQSPAMMKYFDGGPKTMEQAKKRFGEVMEHREKYGFSYLNVFLKSTKEYIGQAGLYYNYDMSVNLCFAFLEKFQHRGYATEAVIAILKYGFEKLNFSVITAMSAPENLGSRHLLEKMGARYTFERKLFSGMVVLCYSIYKDEFYKAIERLKERKYRKGVGALLINDEGLIYLFQRKDFPENWQAPEGGMDEGETETQAVYREVEEEIGIGKDKLKLLGETKNYIRYNYSNGEIKHGCCGQDKKFFLFRFLGDKRDFAYTLSEGEQEFTAMKLVSKEEALALVPEFKKNMYGAVFGEFGKQLK